MEQNDFKAPVADRYGFARRFLVCSDRELIAAFNREVGNDSCLNGRADYLFHLKRELLGRDLDCSEVINGHTLCMTKRVTLVDNRLVV